MHISVRIKLVLFCVFLVCPACGIWQSSENTNSVAELSREIESKIPFATKEPDLFQTEIVVTNFLSGEKDEKKYFLARNGAKSLLVIDYGKPDRTAILRSGDQTFLVDHGKKAVREAKKNIGVESETSEFLTNLLLNPGAESAFEKIGTDNGLTKYRAGSENSAGSEIFIFVDENLKLPVRQEFYSTAGDRKTLTMTVELKNFSLQADEYLFNLPQNYKQVNAK